MSIFYVVLRFCSYVLVFDVKVYMSRVWAGGSNLWIAWEEEKKPHIMHISYKILCCPAGLRPVSSGPPLCPCLRSTNIAPFVTHSHSGRKWLHTQRMNQHHQTTTPFSSGQRSVESWGSQSVCVWNVCEVSLWSLVSGGQFEWLTYLRERFCGMSGMCVCKYVLFLSVCVCVCMHLGRWRVHFWSSVYVMRVCVRGAPKLEVCMGFVCVWLGLLSFLLSHAWRILEWPLKTMMEWGHLLHSDVTIVTGRPLLLSGCAPPPLFLSLGCMCVSVYSCVTDC